VQVVDTGDSSGKGGKKIDNSYLSELLSVEVEPNKPKWPPASTSTLPPYASTLKPAPSKTQGGAPVVAPPVAPPASSGDAGVPSSAADSVSDKENEEDDGEEDDGNGSAPDADNGDDYYEDDDDWLEY
jgi:hypothetical protein